MFLFDNIFMAIIMGFRYVSLPYLLSFSLPQSKVNDPSHFFLYIEFHFASLSLSIRILYLFDKLYLLAHIRINSPQQPPLFFFSFSLSQDVLSLSLSLSLFSIFLMDSSLFCSHPLSFSCSNQPLLPLSLL